MVKNWPGLEDGGSTTAIILLGNRPKQCKVVHQCNHGIVKHDC